MGFLDRFRPQKIEAQNAPQIMSENWQIAPLTVANVSRADAVSVPSIARAASLIKGIIASTPLEVYRDSTGEEIDNAPAWVKQPSPSQPRSVTMAWTVDSLIFYGQAFWQVTSVSEFDGRPLSFEWVPNSRVTFNTDLYTEFITQYFVNGNPVPMSGIGSLVTFQSLGDEGVLVRGGRTIRAAVDLEKATSTAVATPMPTGVIKNTGADLSEAEALAILNSFEKSRKNRATAYMTSTLDYQVTQFSPKDMTYNESAQFMATQVARMMNVPAWYLSAEMNNSMTYANVIDERKQFVDLSLRPYYAAIEDRLSLDDITPRGNIVRFAIDDTFLRSDAMERLNVIEKMLSLGLITVEQAMEMEDLTPNGSNVNETDIL
ncbi:MAG: phage portal protein [Polynucleobacter sp.]